MHRYGRASGPRCSPKVEFASIARHACPVCGKAAPRRPPFATAPDRLSCPRQPQPMGHHHPSRVGLPLRQGEAAYLKCPQHATAPVRARYTYPGEPGTTWLRFQSKPFIAHEPLGTHQRRAIYDARMVRRRSRTSARTPACKEARRSGRPSRRGAPKCISDL